MTHNTTNAFEGNQRPMNPIEQAANFAKEGNVDNVALLLKSAAEQPGGELAKKFETAGLRIEAHEFFADARKSISLLKQNRPAIIDVNAADTLAQYESLIKEHLARHTNGWQQLAAESSPDKEVQVRADTLQRLQSFLASGENILTGSPIVAKSLAEMSTVPIDADGLRDGIALSAEQVTENIWAVVLEGRDAMTDSRQYGADTNRIQQDYVAETDTYFTNADTVAAGFMKAMLLEESN